MKSKQVNGRAMSHRGIGVIQLLIVVFVLGLLVFAGTKALQSRNTVADKYQALAQRDFFDKASGTVSDFYDCLDRTGDFTPGVPQTCEYLDQTYKRPVAFDEANIRNFDRLPESSKATARVIAKKNFDICSDVPETLSVTKVLNAVDGYVYLATGCDGGYAAILVRQGLAWREINLGQSGLSCETAEEHGIPKALVYNEDIPESGKCYLANGKMRSL